MGGGGRRPPLPPPGRPGRERLAAASRSNLGSDDVAALSSNQFKPRHNAVYVWLRSRHGQAAFKIQAHEVSPGA